MRVGVKEGIRTVQASFDKLHVFVKGLAKKRRDYFVQVAHEAVSFHQDLLPSEDADAVVRKMVERGDVAPAVSECDVNGQVGEGSRDDKGLRLSREVAE